MRRLPKESFRIRPKPTSPYWALISIYDTAQDMRKSIRTLFDGTYAEVSNIEAITVSGFFKDKYLAAAVLFHMGSIQGTSEIVAHELAHAGFRVLEARNKRVSHWTNTKKSFCGSPAEYVTDEEEEYCTIVQNLNKEFWDKFDEWERGNI